MGRGVDGTSVLLGGIMSDLNRHKVRELIAKSSNVVFFGGAGVSTASGIPDFRSATGLYNQKTQSSYSPEYMLSHTFMVKHPEEFSDYYRSQLIFPDVRPNPAHEALATLERQGHLKWIITQNIDGLHQQAGSTNVLEIHGNLTDYYCVDCGATYPLDRVMEMVGAPTCGVCGGFVRPDVVLYEEPLNNEVHKAAIDAVSGAEIFIVGGTSLVVYPAAGLLRYFNGKALVLINRDETAYDRKADYVFHGDISEILPSLVDYS